MGVTWVTFKNELNAFCKWQTTVIMSFVAFVGSTLLHFLPTCIHSRRGVCRVDILLPYSMQTIVQQIKACRYGYNARAVWKFLHIFPQQGCFASCHYWTRFLIPPGKLENYNIWPSLIFIRCIFNHFPSTSISSLKFQHSTYVHFCCNWSSIDFIYSSEQFEHLVAVPFSLTIKRNHSCTKFLSSKIRQICCSFHQFNLSPMSRFLPRE